MSPNAAPDSFARGSDVQEISQKAVRHRVAVMERPETLAATEDGFLFAIKFRDLNRPGF
jgi:hypothetical protein